MVYKILGNYTYNKKPSDGFLLKLFFVSLIISLSMLALPFNLKAAERENIATLDILSTYVWRGQKLSGDRGVIQPHARVANSNWSAGLWLNYDTELGEGTETDFSLSYRENFEDVDIEGGGIYYVLDGAHDTAEIFLKLSSDIIFNPAVTGFYDLEFNKGAYLLLSLNEEFELNDDVSVDFGISAGVNFQSEALGVDKDGNDFTAFYNGEVSLALNVDLGDGLILTPKIAFSAPLSRDARFALESISVDGESEVVYGGFGFSLEL